MLNNVMATMRDDKAMLVAKCTKVILGVGKLLVEKHGITRAQATTETMRKLARLPIQLRRMDKNYYWDASACAIV